VILADLDTTRALGAALAEGLRAQGLPAGLLLFRGPLGAGKTTLIRALIAGLGVAGPVRSPTYTLIEPYPLAGGDLFHVDLYRLRNPAELDDLGFADLLDGRSLCLVEWPERAPGLAGHADLLIDMDVAGRLRKIAWEVHTGLGQALAVELEACAATRRITAV
jgi:tRNA threonylcarbamoyladenosine biosynthesis protein TsaE